MVTRNVSTAGITETPSGVRKVPESFRPDGTVRREKLIRPGFVPEEDQSLYVNPAVQRLRHFEASNFGRRVVGQQLPEQTGTPQTKAAKKNAKRKEAKKSKKTAGGDQPSDDPKAL